MNKKRGLKAHQKGFRFSQELKEGDQKRDSKQIRSAFEVEDDDF